MNAIKTGREVQIQEYRDMLNILDAWIANANYHIMSMADRGYQASGLVDTIAELNASIICRDKIKRIIKMLEEESK